MRDLLVGATKGLSLHVDVSHDVGVVADVQAKDAEKPEDLRKSIGSLLSIARLRAQNRGRSDQANLLDLARVRSGDGAAFRVEAGVPHELVKSRLQSCVDRQQRSRPVRREGPRHAHPRTDQPSGCSRSAFNEASKKTNPSGTIELMKGGKLRVLAITAGARDTMYPDIPTMKESGFPEFETSVWSAFFMRAETPDDVVEKLAAAIDKVMTSDAGRAYQASQPSKPMMMGPKALGEFQLREFQRFKRVAEAAGIKPE